MAARVLNVAQHDGAAFFARVVDNHVAITEQALPNGGLDCHVLDSAKRNIARRTRHQTLIYLDLGISQGVTNPVALEMIISRDEQKR